MSNVAIISDTHDRVPILRETLRQFEKHKIKTIFHCGDVARFETAYLMAGFQVIYCYGNGDHEYEKISATLKEANSASVTGFVCEIELDGRRIATTHSHMPGKLTELANSGKYDFVFYGHTHRQKMQQINDCVVINPGALGNPNTTSLNFAILDLKTGAVDFY